MNILPKNTGDQIGSLASPWAEVHGTLVYIAGTAAAKTNQKLDDFGTPDDNTDLDATTGRHGLMSKADKIKLDSINLSQITDGDMLKSVYDPGNVAANAFAMANMTGTVSSSQIGDGQVTLAKMASMATASILGRTTAGTGVVEVLSASAVRGLLNVADGANNYVLPTPTTTVMGGVRRNTGSAGQYVSGIDTDGALLYGTPSGGGGVSDGDKGDITVSLGGVAWTIDNGAVTLAKMDNMATASLLGRNTAGTGVPEVLSASTVRSLLNVADGANNYSHPNHTGDVTSSGDGATTIANNAVTTVKINDGAVTLAKLANMATASLLGRNTAGTGIPEVLSASTVRTLLNVADGANNYSLPTPTTTVIGGVKRNTGSAGQYVSGIDADGALLYGTPSGGGGVSDGDKGDITVSASGATWNIDNGAVTLAKMANLNPLQLIGRHDDVSAGQPQEVSVGGGLTFLGSQLEIQISGVTLAKMADMATASFLGRSSAGTGVPQVLSAATARSVLSYKGQLGIVIDGAGSTITTGFKGYLRVPYNCTINSVQIVANESGSIVVDIWRDTYANFPPVVGDTIVASAKPTLSSAQKSQDTTLTNWTKILTEGDYLAFNVDSATTVSRVTLSLVVTRTT